MHVCLILHAYSAPGLNLAPTFSRQSTHLLCPTRTGAKYEKALEWGVPVVGMEWLVEMVRTARIPDVEVRERENELQMEVDMPLDKKGKGKAKEKEGGDVKMVEITNSGLDSFGGVFDLTLLQASHCRIKL